MKYTLRAMLAVLLLIGFYVVCVALVIGLGWGAIELAAWGLGGLALGKLWIFVAVVAYAVFRGLTARTRNQTEDPGGLLLTESQQPELWQEVRALADAAQTRVPDEIRLIPAVNAAVSEDTRLLGLLGGTRRLYLGVPLLMGMSRAQVRSILAHELGHYSGKHTALGALTYRGTEAIARVIGNLGADSLVAKPLKLYGRLYVAVSNTVNRRQELEADQLSARLVGPATAASALLRLPPLDAAWTFFLQEYAGLGREVGHRPMHLFDGFSQLLSDPERQRQMAEMREVAQQERRSVFDSHPPISERVAAFGATPEERDDSGSALALLRDVPGVLATLEDHLFEGSNLTAAPLEELVPTVGAAAARDNAHSFLSAMAAGDLEPATLGGAVSLVTSGRGNDLLGLVEADGDPERSRRVIARVLGDTIAHALISEGGARYRLNWAGPMELVSPEGTLLDPWQAVHDALASPEHGPSLEAWLDKHGVRRDLAAPSAIPPAETAPDAPTGLIGAVAVVTGHGFRVLAVADSGILLCKPTGGDRWAILRSSLTFGDPAKPLLRRTLERDPASLTADPKVVHLRWSEIESVHLKGRALGGGKVAIHAVGGRSWTIKAERGAVYQGHVWEPIEHFLGDRFSRT